MGENIRVNHFEKLKNSIKLPPNFLLFFTLNQSIIIIIQKVYFFIYFFL